MTSVYRQGLSIGSIIPSVYNDIEAMKILRTPNIFFVDNYEKLFKRYGFSRQEMMLVIGQLMKVDPLSGRDILEYVE
jgi:hypothetical protein